MIYHFCSQCNTVFEDVSKSIRFLLNFFLHTVSVCEVSQIRIAAGGHTQEFISLLDQPVSYVETEAGSEGFTGQLSPFPGFTPEVVSQGVDTSSQCRVFILQLFVFLLQVN